MNVNNHNRRQGHAQAAATSAMRLAPGNSSLTAEYSVVLRFALYRASCRSLLPAHSPPRFRAAHEDVYRWAEPREDGRDGRRWLNLDRPRERVFSVGPFRWLGRTSLCCCERAGPTQMRFGLQRANPDHLEGLSADGWATSCVVPYIVYNELHIHFAAAAASSSLCITVFFVFILMHDVAIMPSDRNFQPMLPSPHLLFSMWTKSGEKPLIIRLWRHSCRLNKPGLHTVTLHVVGGLVPLPHDTAWQLACPVVAVQTQASKAHRES